MKVAILIIGTIIIVSLVLKAWKRQRHESQATDFYDQVDDFLKANWTQGGLSDSQMQQIREFKEELSRLAESPEAATEQGRIKALADGLNHLITEHLAA